jgi:hypothetical protein
MTCHPGRIGSVIALVAVAAFGVTGCASSTPTPTVALATPRASSSASAPAPSTPAAPASPSPSPTPAASPSPAAVDIGPFDATWTQAARPATGHANDWESIADGSPRWTTLGDQIVMVIPYDTPEVYRSADGIHWEAAPLPGVQGGTSDAAVSRSGAGLIAWATLDEGEGTWTSRDGVTWSMASDSPLTEGQQWLLKAIARGGSWDGPIDVTGFTGPAFPGDDGEATVFGSGDQVSVFVPSSGKVAVWRSAGGGPWTQAAALPGSDGGAVKLVAAGPHGWFAFGCASQCEHNAGWTSPDGISWTKAAKVPGSSVTAIAAMPEGDVAVGWTQVKGGCVRLQSDVAGITWTSADGSTWRRMSPPMSTGTTVNGLIPVNGTLVGLGLRAPDPGDVEPVTWTASIAPADGGTPAPTPKPGHVGC